MSVESIAAAVDAGQQPVVGGPEDVAPPTNPNSAIFLTDEPSYTSLADVVTQLRIANLIAYANAAPTGSPRREAALTEAEEHLWGIQ